MSAEPSTLTLTLRLPLQVDEHARPILLEVGNRYTASYNRVAAVGWKSHIRHGVELHRKTYRWEKSALGLPAQLTISARMRAFESLKSVRARIKKGGKGSCPKSQWAGVRYDARSATLNLEQGWGTFATLQGQSRIRLSFQVPEIYKPYIGNGWKTGSSEIVRDGRRFYLHVTVSKVITLKAPTGRVLGVDLGVNRPAVTSDNRFHGERRWRAVEQRYHHQRRELQAKGTKAAKRKLKALSGRQQRLRRELDHVISKRIVDSLKAGDVLVLEDLTDIRERVRAGQAETRRRIHGWSFAQLKSFVEYKALRLGIHVIFVDPAYSSQTCSRCGHCERANRAKQNRFCCRACGFTLHADLNASRNLEQRGRVVLATRSITGPESTGPHVSQCAPPGVAA